MIAIKPKNGLIAAADEIFQPYSHGKHLARAIGSTPYTLSARTTTLNPQDIVFDTLLEQKSHVTHLYETVLGRPLTGGQKENMERVCWPIRSSGSEIGLQSP